MMEFVLSGGVSCQVNAMVHNDFDRQVIFLRVMARFAGLHQDDVDAVILGIRSSSKEDGVINSKMASAANELLSSYDAWSKFEIDMMDKELKREGSFSIEEARVIFGRDVQRLLRLNVEWNEEDYLLASSYVSWVNVVSVRDVLKTKIAEFERVHKLK